MGGGGRARRGDRSGGGGGQRRKLKGVVGNKDLKKSTVACVGKCISLVGSIRYNERRYMWGGGRRRGAVRGLDRGAKWSTQSRKPIFKKGSGIFLGKCILLGIPAWCARVRSGARGYGNPSDVCQSVGRKEMATKGEYRVCGNGRSTKLRRGQKTTPSARHTRRVLPAWGNWGEDVSYV